jgi:hypothetical protein
MITMRFGFFDPLSAKHLGGQLHAKHNPTISGKTCRKWRLRRQIGVERASLLRLDTPTSSIDAPQTRAYNYAPSGRQKSLTVLSEVPGNTWPKAKT